MSTKKVSQKLSTDNGQPLGDAAEPVVVRDADLLFDPEELERDGRFLKESVENPGVAEIPEVKGEDDDHPITEIPPRNLDPEEDDGGQPLSENPDLMVVKVDRPGPHSWIRVYPEKCLRTVLLAYKPSKDSSPEYHFVVPELEKGLKRDLKQVRVYLVFDASSDGGAFLWIIPESNFSPYYNALKRITDRGPEFTSTNLFRFCKVELKKKDCDVRVRPVTADDPAPILPSRRLNVLLYEALSPDRIIKSTSHPVYMALACGGKF